MKKSLTLLLAFAMVFSMFSAVAFADETTTTDDAAAPTELTTQQKYDALAAKGIFAGINGEAALDQNMNRAQFARVAALILGLEGIGNPDTKTVTEKPFSDVELGLWYTEEIAAVKEAKVFVGNADGTFNPKGDITIQELAVVAAGLLGLQPVEGATVEGAADWAAGYIKAIQDAGIAFPTNYTEAATRADLVNLSYSANEKINPVEPAKVSIASAAATGVHEVTVTLDKAVNTDDAKFTLKKGTTTITLGDTKWDEAKKVAKLPVTNVKISEGTYTVTLSGLAADTVDKNTAEFKAENETVKKIEFVTTSDEIAQSTKAQIKLRAENQYGELASFNASSYTVNAMNLDESLKKNDDGYLVVTLDTSDDSLIPGVSQIPVYVYFDDTRVTAQKTFKLGTTPFVSKLDLGELEYTNGKEALTKSGESAEAVINLYDQYGNPVTPEQADADELSININSVIAPYSNALEASSSDDDDVYKLKISVKADEDIEKAATHTVTVYAGSASGTTNVAVESSRVAMNVKIGDVDGVLAEDDTDVYVPITVTDVNGEALTAQEIVDNAERITISTSSANLTLADPEITTVGKHKGQIHIASVHGAGGYGFISASIISQNANSYDNKQFKIEDPRVPDSVVVKVKPAAKAVLEATSDFDFTVRDQYGEEYDYEGNGYYVNLKLEYTDTVTTTVYADKGGISLPTASEVNYDNTDAKTFANFNDGFKFDTNTGDEGKAKVTATIYKKTTATPAPAVDEEVSSVSVSIESIDTDTKLYYSLAPINDMYAALDSDLLVGSDLTNPATSAVATEVKLVVKDAAGNTVAYPNSFQFINAANGNIAKTATNEGKAFVLGDEEGTTTITTVFKAADGTTKSLNATINTKSDLVTVKSIVADDDEINPTEFAANRDDVSQLMDLTVTDQYGIKYEAEKEDKSGAKTEVYDYDSLLGIRYLVSDIVGSGTVTIQKNTAGTAYEVVTSGDVKEFVITAISRDGLVSASSTVVPVAD